MSRPFRRPNVDKSQILAALDQAVNAHETSRVQAQGFFDKMRGWDEPITRTKGEGLQ